METQQPPVVENIPPQSSEASNVAPGMDAELDAALAGAFKNNFSQPEQKVESEAQNPVQKESVKETIKDPPPKQEAPKAKGDDLPDPDSIETQVPDKTNSKKGTEAWNGLRNNYKKAREIIQEKDKELEKLKITFADGSSKHSKNLEDLKKQNEDLSKYRAMIDIQADPEFISKYEVPLKEKILEIVDLLKISEEAVRAINYNDSASISNLAKIITDKTGNDILAEDFKSLAKEIRSLSNEKNKVIKTQSEKYKEILESKKKESFSKASENEGKMLSHLKTIVNTKDEKGEFRYPFLNKVAAKEGAAEGEIQQIDAHNKLVDTINSKIEGALKNDTPETRAELAVAAGAAHYLSRQLSAAYSIIKGLQEEVKKISSVSTEKEKGSPRAPARNGSAMVDVDTAMSEFFKR